MTKSTKMAYALENLTAGSMNINYSSSWNEGLSTRDRSLGLKIRDDIRSASYINLDSWIGTSSLSSLGEFNGTMNLRAEMRPNRHEVSLVDQSLTGNFRIDTAISVYNVTKYFYPHVSISKKAMMEDESTILFLINVSNDGNGLLKKLDVSDRLPDGLTFINSSLRPEINGQFVNWTLSTLEIGKKMTLKLRAKVNDDLKPYKNTVKVSALYNGHILTASSSISFTPYYLPYKIISSHKERLYFANFLNNSAVKGQWGDWAPSPCFNATSEAPDCAKEKDDTYDDIEKRAGTCSPYEVP